MKQLICSVFFILLLSSLTAGEYPRNPYVEESLWKELEPYFLPYDHPLRPRLDRIFTKRRATENSESMSKAGFLKSKPSKVTHVLVSKHPKLTGYLIKAHLDDQEPRYGHKEHVFWVLRIKASRIVAEEIKNRNLSHIFTVPQKWIYPLPAEPSPEYYVDRKNFILVVKDVHVHKENVRMWRECYKVNKENLEQLYWFVSDLGLWDCCKIENIPFTSDGHIAFVDTECIYRWPVNFSKLTQALSPRMKKFWLTLPNTKKEP